MGWRTHKADEYTSFEENDGEGYYAFIYDTPAPEVAPAKWVISLHEDYNVAIIMYDAIVKTVEACQKIKFKKSRRRKAA